MSSSENTDPSHNPVEQWSSKFNAVAKCVLNPNGDEVVGCISNGCRSRVAITDLGDESILGRRGLDWKFDCAFVKWFRLAMAKLKSCLCIPPKYLKQADEQVNSSDTVRITVVRENKLLEYLRHEPPKQTDVLIFTGQSKVSLDFANTTWKSSPFSKGWDYRLAQDDGIDTYSATVVVFCKHDLWDITVDGPIHSRTGKKSTGIVAKIYILDKRMGPSTGRRVGIYVVPSIVFPRKTASIHDQDHGAFGHNIHGPGGPKLCDDIQVKVAKDVYACVSDSMKNRMPAFVMASKDYFQISADNWEGLRNALETLGLNGFEYCSNEIWFSPVIPSLTKEVVLNQRGELIWRIYKTDLLNAHGSCCHVESDSNDLCGFGKHEEPVVAPSSYQRHVGPEYMMKLKGYKTRRHEVYTTLSAAEDGVHLIAATNAERANEAIEALEQMVQRVSAFDCEWNPLSQVLGTVSLAYYSHEGIINLLYFPLQLIQDLGVDGLWDRVIAALRKFFSRPDILFVGFDIKNDIEVLNKAHININRDRRFDLKKHMGSVFPIAYSKYEGSGEKSMETDLGLRHFVQMALEKNLSKQEQLSDWTVTTIQENEVYINYAVTDAYAVLLVHTHYVEVKNYLERGIVEG